MKKKNKNTHRYMKNFIKYFLWLKLCLFNLKKTRSLAFLTLRELLNYRAPGSPKYKKFDL